MNAVNSEIQTVGVVLAGGRSSRMGKDKALLEINASSMIDRTVRTLEETSVRKVVVSRNDGKAEHLADLIPNKGPLSGIHSVAARFPHLNLIVVPVDLPLIDAKTLQQLINNGQKAQKNVRYKKQNMPIYINNTAHFRKVIEDTLHSNESYSLRKLCSHFPIVELDSPNTFKMFNANTPEEWQFAKQHFENNIFTNKSYEKLYESFE
jgi:molybdopterin-guanine dinucleotide biosynthesis protein A